MSVTPAPAATYRRKITSSTALRFMHVTLDMVKCLGLHSGCPASPTSLPSPAGSPGRSTGDVHASSLEPEKGDNASRNLPLFQCSLTLRDATGSLWPISYEFVISSNQYHRRFSKGWRDLCRHHSGARVQQNFFFLNFRLLVKLFLPPRLHLHVSRARQPPHVTAAFLFSNAHMPRLTAPFSLVHVRHGHHPRKIFSHFFCHAK
jgi:hypothetical protein